MKVIPSAGERNSRLHQHLILIEKDLRPYTNIVRMKKHLRIWYTSMKKGLKRGLSRE